MTYYLLIIVAIVGLILGFNSARKDTIEKNEDIINSRVKKKHENKATLLVYIKIEKKVTNDMIEKFLGISNATAERYLNELEKEGIIKQVGETGRGVYYELNE